MEQTEAQPFSLKLSDLEKKKLDEKSEIPTQNLDEIARGLNLVTSETETPKKRGRKSNEEKLAELQSQDGVNQKLAEDFIDTISPLLRMLMDMGLTRLPNGSKLTNLEYEMFSKTLIPVAKKYAPKIGAIQPEYIALASLAIIVTPRMIVSKE